MAYGYNNNKQLNDALPVPALFFPCSTSTLVLFIRNIICQVVVTTNNEILSRNLWK